MVVRHGRVSKREKGQILDQVCEVTGYTRKYALTLLKDPPPDELPVKRTRRRLPSYGPAEVDLLQGDASKAKKILDWEPKVRFEELVRIMVDTDMDLLSRNSFRKHLGKLP